MYSDIYKREIKVQTENWKKKKKKKRANQNGTIDEQQWKMLYEQCKNTIEKRAQIDDWEKKKSDEQYILNIPTSVTKHLFSIVVSRSFIFYHFILTYKKLTPQ